MRKLCALFLLWAGLFSAQAQDFGDAQVNRLYKAILTEGFLSDKTELGVRLGKMKSAPARQALLELLTANSYWDRTAAAHGLFALNDPSVRPVLLERMFSDHMISDEIEEQFANGISVYYAFLSDRYRKTAGEEERKKILDIICRTGNPAGASLLRDIIRNRDAPDRVYAFKKLIAVYKGNYELAKKYLHDRNLREYALHCVLAEGSSRDLPLFTEVLARNEEPALQILGYQAVNRWAPAETKREVYLQSLGETEEILVRAGMEVFQRLYDDRIRDRLIPLVKNAAYQETRLSAAERLASSGPAAAAPYVIPIFKERYIEAGSNTVIDFFAAMFTLGISTLFDSLARNMSRDNFDNRIGNINAALRKTTGAALPPSYQAWADWAVFAGYTVDGANLVQYLFSSYPAKRAQAIERAVRLLGYRDRKDFIAKNKNLNLSDDKKISFFLAGQLLDKGFWRDEPMPAGD